MNWHRVRDRLRNRKNFISLCFVLMFSAAYANSSESETIKAHTLTRNLSRNHFFNKPVGNVDFPHTWSSILQDRNGKEATQGQFPYVISITMIGYHYCVGVLISAKWILSVAQCFNFSPHFKSIVLIAGMINRTDTEPCVEKRNVTHIYIHPKFFISEKCRLIAHDIALLEADKPFPKNRFIRPVMLARERRSLYGKVTLLGWTETDGIYSLKYTEARLLDRDGCRMARTNYPPSGYKYHPESMICAAPIPPSPTLLCLGNAGSPIVQDNTLIGLSSVGDNPCKWNINRKYVGFYTKAIKYTKFIRTHTDVWHEDYKCKDYKNKGKKCPPRLRRKLRT